MIEAWIAAIACAAPGLPDWPTARRVLRGESPYVPVELPRYQPRLLPPNERRRAPPAVRQAFRVAEGLFESAPLAARDCATVFASSDGDTSITQRISIGLATPTRTVSPTDFHNTVHNAAAGYWSIAADARLASTALSAWNASFAAGLLEAAAFAAVERQPTLLVAYDVAVPEPLHAKRPIDTSVGVALLLAPQATRGALARLGIEAAASAQASTLPDAGLEALRLGNPAARALPLLAAVARKRAAVVELAEAEACGLRVHVQPA
ncbi:MAG TPA: beta-ketoacyl synthase chain length factor [Nevskiaceae bacterium]